MPSERCTSPQWSRIRPRCLVGLGTWHARRRADRSVEHTALTRAVVVIHPHTASPVLSFPKTVASQVGDIELDVPRDREGSFTPTLVPKDSVGFRASMRWSFRCTPAE